MAFQIPGIQGRPIHANNFTNRFRANPRILEWGTFLRDATFLDGATTRMVPRKGPRLFRNSGGSPVWASQAGRDYASFPTGGAGGFWENYERLPNAGPGFGATIVMRPSEGYVEPMAVRFSNGDLVFPQPNHGGATGLVLRSNGVNNGVTGLGASLGQGSIIALNFSYRYSDRRISWQSGMGAIAYGTAPSEWGNLVSSPEFDLIIGRAYAVQPFVGEVLDVGLWGSDFLSNEDDVSLVSEYISTAYGI